MVKLSQLSAEVIPIDLISPTGTHIELHMRAIKFAELQLIRRRVLIPTPPVSDMRRNAQGVIERIYNENDPMYLAAIDDTNTKVVTYSILACILDLDIDGETEEERYQNYIEGVDAWAATQLIAHFNSINGFGETAMAEAQKELTPFVVENLPSLEVLEVISGSNEPSESNES